MPFDATGFDARFSVMFFDVAEKPLYILLPLRQAQLAYLGEIPSFAFVIHEGLVHGISFDNYQKVKWALGRVALVFAHREYIEGKRREFNEDLQEAPFADGTVRGCFVMPLAYGHRLKLYDGLPVSFGYEHLKHTNGRRVMVVLLPVSSDTEQIVDQIEAWVGRLIKADFPFETTNES